jgi:photosynthetic reaction center H subunit
MPTGAITGYIDVAQLVLYAFWIFFAGLILYLRREDKREGYPLENERSGFVRVQGFPPLPAPKTFLLPHGGTYSAPSGRKDDRPIHAKPVAAWPGAPLQPTGNPMTDGVGPASYAQREDVPEYTFEGEAVIVPMRVALDATVDPSDPDPRGMNVIGCDNKVAGTVDELWVDRSEPQIRYLEVAVAGGDRRVLLPINLARIVAERRQVEVASILASQFADAPVVRNPDQVTKLEEDRITAYFASGNLYATRARSEPIL